MIFTYPKLDPEQYASASPFPHIAVRDAWYSAFLKQVADEFPDLDKVADRKFNNKYEGKLVTHGEAKLSPAAKQLIRECNSETFLLWLTDVTGIRHLMPDPYLIGGGYHEIKPGGKLGVHVDFNKHGLWGADRRINVLIYLNEDWKEEWLGGIGLYDKDKRLVKRYTPDFNTMVIFSTTDDSWHGHPEPLQCPQGRSRMSIALYYYTAPDIDWHARDTVFTDAK